MRRVWTTGDLREVERLAGRVPAEEIRRRLGLTERQLAYACEVLRSQGREVSLRCYRSSLEVCPSCGHMRSTTGASGICEPCRLMRRIARTDAEISALMARLPPEQRDAYMRTESRLGSALEPLPSSPETKGLDAYGRARAEEEHELEVERVTAKNLRRRLKAAQRRKERIEKKVPDGGRSTEDER